MKLIDMLKDAVLSPGGRIDGEPVDGYIDAEWFDMQFADLAQADTPLTDEQYAELKSIDKYWAQNAERWRAEGLI